MALPRAALTLLAAALTLEGAACTPPDPKQELALDGLETYWAIDHSVGGTHYMAPVVGFALHNKAQAPQRYVQATATFRRKGEEGLTWGSGFEQVASSARPLNVGKQTVVELKSDARYYSTGSPESMFEHKLFKDARVEVFLRVGASGWVKMAEADIERHIGSKSVQSP